MNEQEGFIDVTGGKVWYRIAGSGNSVPLMVLHGGPGYPHDDLEALDPLADQRPVVYYDQLGCGKSDRPDDLSLWKAQRFVEELGQVRYALGLDKVHILGHSWGSMLATDYALTQPEGLVGLILASPPISVPRWLEDAERLKATLPVEVQEAIAKHETAGTVESEEYQEATKEFNKRFVCRLDPWPEVMIKSEAGIGKVVYETMWGPTEFYMTGNLADYDRSGQLKEIKAPTLFTCGRYDEATPESTAWYQSLLPGSELAILEHSAHMTHLEETERYIGIVRGFLDRAEAG